MNTGVSYVLATLFVGLLVAVFMMRKTLFGNHLRKSTEVVEGFLKEVEGSSTSTISPTLSFEDEVIAIKPVYNIPDLSPDMPSTGYITEFKKPYCGKIIDGIPINPDLAANGKRQYLWEPDTFCDLPKNRTLPCGLKLENQVYGRN